MLRIGGDGAGQQGLRLAVAALAQPHQPQPAECVGILGRLLQHRLEGCLRRGDAVAVQRLEARLALRPGFILWGAGGVAGLGQLPLRLLVVRIALQIGFQPRDGRGVGTVPAQRLPPGIPRLLCHVRALGKLLEQADALRARALAPGQGLGIGELQGPVARIAVQLPLQPIAALGIAVGRPRQGLVVFLREDIRRGIAAENLPVARHRRRVLPRLRQPPGLGHLCRVGGGAAELGLGAAHHRIAGRDLPQPRQGAVRRGPVALLRLGLGESGQCRDIVGIGGQHTLQRPDHLLRPALAAPVVRLVEEDLDRAVLGPGRRRQRRGGEEQRREIRPGAT